jgi:hypothetical protein
VSSRDSLVSGSVLLDTVATDLPSYRPTADKIGRTNTILPFLTLAGCLLFIFPLCTSVGFQLFSARMQLTISVLFAFAARRTYPFRHPLRLRVRRSRFPPTGSRRAVGTDGIRWCQSRQHDCLPSARIRLPALCRADPRRGSGDRISVVGRLFVQRSSGARRRQLSISREKIRSRREMDRQNLERSRQAINHV